MKLLAYLKHLKNPTLLAVVIALISTGFLRLQLFTGLPETDSGLYTFTNQYIYHALINGQDLKGMSLSLYSLMTAWVYGLEVNQFILLRLIDGLVAIAASIILFRVILKESGSTLFTIILVTPLLILMNDSEIVMYGFRNSIWAAFIPLFLALLIWQNSTNKDRYTFYSIGGLISLGVLLREPFLPFFIFAGIAILISYGWRVLVKYLIGSAVVGFSVLGVILMLRGWDLVDLINSYLNIGAFYKEFNFAILLPLINTVKHSWFILIASIVSLIYLTKLHFSNKNLVSVNRVYFWLLVALIPAIEPILKVGFPYHYAQCLIGFSGLSALGWKYLSNNKSKRVNTLSMLSLSLISMLVIFPEVNNSFIKQLHVNTSSDVISWIKSRPFRHPELIKNNQYLITSAKIYELSREDSTLVTSGIMQAIYPLTGLLPPAYKLHDLGQLYLKLDKNEVKLIQILKEYRPTLIMTSGIPSNYEKALPDIIEKTNLYEVVYRIKGNQKINYGWKFKEPGIIYRLKDFK